MKRMAVPKRRFIPLNKVSVSDCVITSSALVGSSAISRDGRCRSDMAIKTRCAMPTLNSRG